MVYLKNIKYLNTSLKEILADSKLISKMKKEIKKGDIYVIEKVFEEEWITGIKKYLTQVGQHSIPNYHKIEFGAPNSHRLNMSDNRSYVKGCFHQFVFFPWNQDYFNFFEKCKDVFYLKNLISGIEKNKYLKKEPGDDCTSRIAVQFYPRGEGYLNKHSDPVDYHQITVPSLTMSKKGIDYKTGGAFIENSHGEKIIIDDTLNVGDLLFFNAELIHGVDHIDKNKKSSWLDFQGRWMMLFSVNKLYDNKSIVDSIDLDESR